MNDYCIGCITATHCEKRGSCMARIDANMEPAPPEPTPTDIRSLLREDFPHGHANFLPITLNELQLHSDKNHDYAAGGSALGNFERVAAILALYPGLNLSDKKVVALVYALKQLDAVLWGMAKGIKQKVEGLKERLGDISVYSKIVMCMVQDEADQAAATKAFDRMTR